MNGRYKAGAEKPLLAKLRILGIDEPTYMTPLFSNKTMINQYDFTIDKQYAWLPFGKLRYAERRNLWGEFNRQVEILLRRHADGR